MNSKEGNLYLEYNNKMSFHILVYAVPIRILKVKNPDRYLRLSTKFYLFICYRKYLLFDEFKHLIIDI